MLKFVLVCVSLSLSFQIALVFRSCSACLKLSQVFGSSSFGCLGCVEWFRFLISKLSCFEFFNLF